MQAAFLNYIKEQNLFSPEDKILLAVSGGIDSVVMCKLFHDAGFDFAIAHYNFKLRGKESEGDEEFVRQLAKKYDRKFYVAIALVEGISKEKKLSIQQDARNLRYDFFDYLQKEHNYKYTATAHHLNDSMETFFINLVRGSGISGFHGILPKRENIVRPLMFATREEIAKYAADNKIKYREDSSNSTDKYTRNKIRNKVVPVLKQLNPSLEKTMQETTMRMQAVEAVYYAAIDAEIKRTVRKDRKTKYFMFKKVSERFPRETLLYEVLKSEGFNSSQVKEINSALDRASGKIFYSQTHRAVKDRDELIIELMPEAEYKAGIHNINVKQNQKKANAGDIELHFTTKTADAEIPKDNDTVSLDFDKLKFPLVIRKWQQGDSFYPLNMKGKKKLSDFFIDKKLSISDKEKVWLLTSEDKIVWVIGMRPDDRFKVTPKTKKIFFAKLMK